MVSPVLFFFFLLILLTKSSAFLLHLSDSFAQHCSFSFCLDTHVLHVIFGKSEIVNEHKKKRKMRRKKGEKEKKETKPCFVLQCVCLLTK